MKLVRKQSIPISGDTGLYTIQKLAEQQTWLNKTENTNLCQGKYTNASIINAYVHHLLGMINSENISPIKLVVNSGNGAAGHIIDELEKKFKILNIPIQFIKDTSPARFYFSKWNTQPIIA